MTNIYKHSEESGRSMVEMLGVLAIVGVLSIGGITGYTKAMAKYKVNSTLDQISMLVTNIRSTFGNQASYTGLTAATAIQYGIADRDLSHGTTSTLTNPFGGDVTITVEDGGAAFTVTYEDIPETACVSIATADWGGSSASGLSQMQINGGSNTFTWGGTNTLPISFEKASGACGASNSISWTYF